MFCNVLSFLLYYFVLILYIIYSTGNLVVDCLDCMVWFFIEFRVIFNIRAVLNSALAAILTRFNILDTLI